MPHLGRSVGRECSVRSRAHPNVKCDRRFGDPLHTAHSMVAYGNQPVPRHVEEEGVAAGRVGAAACARRRCVCVCVWMRACACVRLCVLRWGEGRRGRRGGGAQGLTRGESIDKICLHERASMSPASPQHGLPDRAVLAWVWGCSQRNGDVKFALRQRDALPVACQRHHSLRPGGTSGGTIHRPLRPIALAETVNSLCGVACLN